MARPSRLRRRRGIVQALCRSLERFQQPTLCRSLGMFRFLAQAAIGSPMHTARLHARRFRRGRPQTRSDLLRSACGPHPRILLLARIGQAKAAPACEATVCPVKLCNPPATKASFTRARAIEPRSLAAEMALGPMDGDFLCRKFLDAVNETRMKNAEGVKLGDQQDIIRSTIGGPKSGRGS